MSLGARATTIYLPPRYGAGSVAAFSDGAQPLLTEQARIAWPDDWVLNPLSGLPTDAELREWLGPSAPSPLWRTALLARGAPLTEDGGDAPTCTASPPKPRRNARPPARRYNACLVCCRRLVGGRCPTLARARKKR